MLDELLLEIAHHRKEPLTIIGIDGLGGVGKTTFAEILSKKISNVQIVRMDDFDVPFAEKMQLSEYRPVGPDTQWHRVLNEVIIPLRSDKSAKYNRYDRVKDKYLEMIEIFPQGVVIIEGVFAVRRELYSHYNFTIWVDCSFDVRVTRALKRDGEVARDLWEKDWLPMEEKYMNVYKPQEYVHYVINTDITA